jgi:hypothetical protein
MAGPPDLHNRSYAWPTAGWHSEDAGRTAARAAEQEGGGAHWDDEGNPVSRDTDRKKS